MKNIDGNKHLPKRESKKINLPEEDNMGGVHYFMIISYFFSLAYVFSLFKKLDLSLLNLFQLFTLFIAVGFLIPIKVYRKKLTISFYEYVFLNLLSFGPVLCALILWINNTFPSETYFETYRIISRERIDQSVIYYLEDDSYKDKEYLRKVDDNDNYESNGRDYLRIHFSNGFFGIRIIEGKSLH